MLLRADDRGVLAIGQPSHAWVSGQLARAWGNDAFGHLEPWEEVCLAAEQHDVGMAAWDLGPSRNPQTGLPHSFIEMPLEVHLDLWRHGPAKLLRQSRYAALLASIHGTRLYERRDRSKLTPEDAAAVQAFLSEQRAFQQDLLGTLRADPTTRASATPRLIQRNSQLIWIWDFLSLALCLDWPPCAATDVPSATSPVELQLRPGDRPGRLIVDPWPFGGSRVLVRCEGQRLTGRFEIDTALREALERAPWETLELELVG